MTDEIFEPSTSRQDAINELEQLSVVELAERVYALENPAPLSQEEAIWHIRDLFGVHNFVGTFFTEEDIARFDNDDDKRLTPEQVAMFCSGRTWNKVLEQVMCEEGFELISIAIAEGEHLGK